MSATRPLVPGNPPRVPSAAPEAAPDGTDWASVPPVPAAEESDPPPQAAIEPSRTTPAAAHAERVRAGRNEVMREVLPMVVTRLLTAERVDGGESGGAAGGVDAE